MEIGLTDSDEFKVRTSADGEVWDTRLTCLADESGLVAPSMRSGEVNVAVDSVVDIPTPATSGFVFLHMYDTAFTQITYSTVFLYEAGASLQIALVYLGSGGASPGTTSVGGTIGSANRTNVLVGSGAIQIENRLAGDPVIYRYAFLR